MWGTKICTTIIFLWRHLGSKVKWTNLNSFSCSLRHLNRWCYRLEIFRDDDFNVNLCLTSFGGGGQQVKGQRLIIEIEKKSSQTPNTCEWKQVRPANLSSICISMKVKKYSQWLSACDVTWGQISNKQICCLAHNYWLKTGRNLKFTGLVCLTRYLHWTNYKCSKSRDFGSKVKNW